MKTILAVGGLIIALLITQGCTHEPLQKPIQGTGNKPAGEGNGGAAQNSGTCFEADILPLLQSNCAKSGCHNSVTHAGDYVLDNYSHIVKSGLVKPGNGGGSKLYTVLFKTGSDQMPPLPGKPLADQQKNLVRKWIDEGALQTTNCSSCDSSKYGFAANLMPILQNNCNGCHSGGIYSAGGIDLTNYSNVASQAANGKLWGSVSHAPGFKAMPENASKLNDCELAVIRKWIEAGAQNN